MAPRIALEQRRSRGLTPYKHEAWEYELTRHGLTSKYPSLSQDLVRGFDVGIPTINNTYIPPNHPSLSLLPEIYASITQKEFDAERYIGPFTQQELEEIIGPFQSSPLSLVPKPGKPGKYRPVHDFSHPYSTSNDIASINSYINIDNFPCTWGTFHAVALLFFRLPPGSRASIRDVAEAYRTIPVLPSQWPGLVVRLQGEDRFAVNTNNNFGLRSAGGVYGMLADAGADIFRANGIGPLSKWVDDHIFFQIRAAYLPKYNQQRRNHARRLL